jgi:hypothetical protein
MRIAAERSNAKVSGGPAGRSRAPHSTRPGVAPPADLLALQQSIGSRPAPRSEVAPAPRTEVPEALQLTMEKAFGPEFPGALAFAARGIASGGSALPHGEAIQRSFGRHDVSGIKAHVGGTAAAASGAIGAQAYASGQHVAFKSAPDIKLAAHEAAHCIQQKGGIQLAGGIGQEGDRFEQHADAVAEAVASGGSAEHLLDELAPPGSEPSGGVQRPVQRKDDKEAWSLDPAMGAAPGAAPRPMMGDLGALGIDVSRPLGAGVGPAAASQGASDDLAVLDWMTAHKADILVTVSMPALIRRVRLEVGKARPSLVIAADQRILELIHGGAAALGLPLPKDELPAAHSAAEVQAAAAQGLSVDYAISLTEANGHFNLVAFGKTPDLSRDGAQLLLDVGGLTLSTRDSGSKSTTTIQGTTDGVKFSTNIGPMSFTAGIDPNQWQIGLSFGPEAPDLAALPGIFASAQRAVGAAARAMAAGNKGGPKALYDTAISPHLPAIKAAVAAARAAAALKPGKPSFGVKATGPGYQPYAAEGAVKGITVMVTLSVTF